MLGVYQVQYNTPQRRTERPTSKQDRRTILSGHNIGRATLEHRYISIERNKYAIIRERNDNLHLYHCYENRPKYRDLHFHVQLISLRQHSNLLARVACTNDNGLLSNVICRFVILTRVQNLTFKFVHSGVYRHVRHAASKSDRKDKVVWVQNPFATIRTLHTHRPVMCRYIL